MLPYLNSFCLQSVNVAFLGCKSFSDVLNTFKLARIMLEETLSGTFVDLLQVNFLEW